MNKKDTHQTLVYGRMDVGYNYDLAKRIYNPMGISACVSAHGSDTTPKVLVEKGGKNVK